MLGQLFCILVFYLAIFLVGVWAGRRRGGDDKTEGLLLAGRSMPLWVGAFTMTATWVGGGYINGTAEAVYDPAMGLVWAQAPWGYALSMVLGGLFFARRMRRHGYTTMLDPFEQRYGKRVAAGLFLPALVGEVFWSAAILVALGTTFGLILDIAPVPAILISAAIAVGYTVVGGLWSVAYTDVVQLFCILIGLCIAIPFALANAGGGSVVIAEYFEQMPSFPRGAEVWTWADMGLLLILGGIPWQVYFQRVLSARDERTAVRLSLIAAGGCVLMAIPAVLIGMIGAVAVSQGTLERPEQAAVILPAVLQNLRVAHPYIATIGLAAVAAAVMSSVDSSILAASSMFAWNVYRPLVRPAGSDRELRFVLRGSIVVVGLAATALALVTRSVYELWFLCADLVYVVLFPQLLMVLFYRRANRTGAITGAIVGLTLRLGAGVELLGLPAIIPFPPNFPFRTVTMLSGLATIWIISRATARFDPPKPLAGPAMTDRAHDG